MRGLLVAIVGIAVGVGAFLFARSAMNVPVAGPTIVFAPGVELTAELDKLPEGSKPTIRIPLGDDASKRFAEAVYEIPEGGTIVFDEGKYEFDRGFELSKPGITIKGAGQEKTILNFSKQAAGSGGEGIRANGDRFTLEELTVEETKGDAVKVERSNGVVMRRVSTLWHNEGNPKNGAYGLYPVTCKNVLIEYCTAVGASDAGIYVGQSENIIVRNCRAEKNVAGIEIENSKNADVYDNTATNNAGGLLIFDLPGLPAGNGGGHRVYKNTIFENNHVNFAPEGNIVATVPAGTGIMVMATDNVEVFENKVDKNQSSNMSIISFLFTGRKIEDPKYDPIPEGIYVHNNEFTGGGDKPAGAIKALALLIGQPYPDILYDGIVNPQTLVEGKAPAEKRIYIENNGDADFINLRFDQVDGIESLFDPKKAAEHKEKLVRDLGTVSGELALRKDPVKIEDVKPQVQ